jgi:hypothetical protein
MTTIKIYRKNSKMQKIPLNTISSAVTFSATEVSFLKIFSMGNAIPRRTVMGANPISKGTKMVGTEFKISVKTKSPMRV